MGHVALRFERGLLCFDVFTNTPRVYLIIVSNVHEYYHETYPSLSRFQWPRGQWWWCVEARLLGLRFRIPPGGAWMSVSCVVCCEVVVSGRADPSSRGVLPCVCMSECNREASTVRSPRLTTVVEL